MDTKICISTLAVFSIISKVLSQGTCPSVVEYMYSFDYTLDDHVIEKFDLLPENWCLAKCNLNKRCRSVNYNAKLSSAYNCELNKATNQQYPKSYNPRPGWVYYENRIADSLPPVVDGRWGAWGPWSSDCPTNCLRERKRWRIRRRTCTNPAPQGDGNDCRGDKMEQDICASPGCFELLQTIKTDFGRSVTTFEVRGELFIAYANYHNRAKQPVYRLQQNKFILNQTLDSYHLVDVEYLTIHGDHFLVVASQYYGTSSKQDYVVYRWEAGKFKEFQRIPTTGAMDTHYFTINTRKYMSFTNGSYKVAIYEWINKTFCHKIQDIQIKRPCRCTTFTIQNITYMVCGTGATVNTVTVLKWSGEQFESFQVLPSSFVNGRPHIIHANGTVYLALANYRGFGNNPDIHSFIYRWNGIKFVHHQSISTHGAMGRDSFSTAAGEVILVVVNSYTMSGTSFKVKSDVYKMVNDTFYLHQQLSTTGAEYVHAFTHKGKQYLVVVNKLDLTNFLLDSPVYLWN